MDNFLWITIGLKMISKFLKIRQEPWVSLQTKKWLESYLNPEMTVFEFGSGGSTIFIGRKVKKVISVEYQRLWFVKVLINLLYYKIFNFKLHLVTPEVKSSNNKYYVSSDPIFKKLNFKNFALAIDEYPDKYFDLVFVDGRARNGCIKHAIRKIKKNGYLLLDDSHRELYNLGKELLKRYKSKKLGDASAWLIK